MPGRSFYIVGMRTLVCLVLVGVTAGGTLSCSHRGPAAVTTVAPEAGERHLTNIRQLTNGGENAEAYFSGDDSRLIFQSTRDGRACDQEFVMNVDGSGAHRVSTGTGKTTCGFFFASDQRILFGSSHAEQRDCPPKPDPSKGYVWRLDPYDMYTARPDGSELRRLTSYGVHSAEGVVSPDGRKVVFTSLKDGALDIYTMNVDGRRLIFSSNYRQPRSGNFDLFLVNLDGTSLEQVTTHESFDGFPMFSPDGRSLVWASNRHDAKPGETNLFISDWTP
jgi:TolB protein